MRHQLPLILLLILLANWFPAMGAATIQHRPRVIMSPGKLVALREEVSQPGWKHEVYLRTVRANADRWVDRTVTIPARGGWVQDLTCTDGNMLKVPTDQDFGTTTSYACAACRAEYSGPKFEAARRRLEHEWLMEAALDLALAGLLEQEDRYLRKSAEILEGYADARFPGHKMGSPGGIFQQSLNDAVAIIRLAQAYDLLASTDILSSASRARIERDVLWESAEGLTRCGLQANWGSWHLSAVGVIGLATGHQRYIDYADQAFRGQMQNELGSDGLWPESVHGYHFYALRAFIDYAEAVANSGRDIYHFEALPRQGLRAMFTAPLSFMYPNRDMPAINDGFMVESMPFEQYEVAWARYKDPQFAWLLSQRPRTEIKRPRGSQEPSARLTLIHGDPLPESVPAPEFQSTDFFDIGTAILRNDSSLPVDQQVMLTFDYGRMLSHGQHDKMGITLFAGGRILAADYGTPSYASAISPYYRGPLSHNTVMTSGTQQASTTHHGRLFFQNDTHLKAASAETTEALPENYWRRTVILDHESNEPIILVIDELESTAPQPYQWAFHSEGDQFHLNGVSESDKVTSPAHFPFLTDIKNHGPTEAALQADWRFTDESGLLLISASGEATAATTAKFPAETASRRIPGIILSRETSQTSYVVALKPYPPPPGAQSAVRQTPPQVAVTTSGTITINDGQTTTEYHLSRTGVSKRKHSGLKPDTTPKTSSRSNGH